MLHASAFNDDSSNRDEWTKATRATLTTTDDTKYIIWAREDTSKKDAECFHNTLLAAVGNKSEVETLVTEQNTPYAWLADLTPAQLGKVRADGVVDRVEPDEQLRLEGHSPAAANRKRANVQRRPNIGKPLVDLRMLSTPPQTPLLDYYEYDDSAGEGITIYMIDTGPFDFEHSELRPMDSSITRENIDAVDRSSLVNAGSFHGTCVASKAVGNTVGVARRANLVTVRIDVTPGKFHFIKAWHMVREDIMRKGLRGKAVVSSSVAFPAVKDKDVRRRTFYEMAKVLQSLFEMDVPVICAAGNSADKPNGSIEPNSLPSVLAVRLPLIVVGSAAVDGSMSKFSQRGPLLTTWAVGEQVQCAKRGTKDGLVTAEGTSVAAPQIAGLAAYFMSHPRFRLRLRAGTVAKDMQSLIRSYSHLRARSIRYPPIAWNGNGRP